MENCNRTLQKGELKKFERLVKMAKNIYPDRIYLDKEILPNNEESIRVFRYSEPTNPVFENSYFITSEIIMPEVMNCVVSIEETINAIKDKVKEIKVIDNEVILFGGKEGTEYFIGKVDIEFNTDAFLNKLNVQSFLSENSFKILMDEYDMNVISELMNSSVVTARPNNDSLHDLALIMTRKLFPNIKKVSSFQLTWIYDDEHEYFYVIMKVRMIDTIPILFFNTLKCLKC